MPIGEPTESFGRRSQWALFHVCIESGVAACRNCCSQPNDRSGPAKLASTGTRVGYDYASGVRAAFAKESSGATQHHWSELAAPVSDSSEECERIRTYLCRFRRDIADALNLTPQLQRLHQLKHHYLVAPKYEEHVELMELRIKSVETLFSAFLDSRERYHRVD